MKYHCVVDEDLENIDKTNKYEVYEYLIRPDKNKAGQYTKESGFKRVFPVLYEELMNYFSNDVYDRYTFKELLYHYFKDDLNLDLGFCHNKNCHNKCKFNDLKNGYYEYCSNKCALSSDEHKEKVKQTCLEKYGSTNVFGCEEIKQTIKQTRIERYGGMCSKEMSDKAIQTKIEKYGGVFTQEMVEKSKQTKLEKYGDSVYNNVEQTKQTKLERYGDSGYHNTEQMMQTKLEKYGDSGYHNIEQMKQTNLERYGKEYYSQTEGFADKMKQTNLERYGDSGYHNIEQMKQTNLERYGKEYYAQTEDFVDKVKQTNLERYGCEYAIGSKKVRDRITSTSIEKYGDENPYRGRLHMELKEKYPELIGFEGNNYICKCQNTSCNGCVEKQFALPSPIFRRRKYQDIELCPILNPILVVDGTSDIEKDILLYIQSIYSGEIIENDRTVLNGKELDIYIPDKKLAIEFNGLYWHSEMYKDKMYHQNKVMECSKKDINLIHIWEDDWFEKREIIKDIIKTKLGLNNKIFARKCEIKDVSSIDAKKFIDEYHIQGNINAKIRIGLYYNNELVEIATFGKLRNIMHSKGSDDQYELYRLCSKGGYTIVGGFSKLIKYFIDKYNPEQIITYASLDISNGGVYNKIFEQQKITSPGYYWTKNGYKYHRSNFTKHKLVDMGYDKNKTEDEIMHELGYYKLYDSGNIKFIYIKSDQEPVGLKQKG